MTLEDVRRRRRGKGGRIAKSWDPILKISRSQPDGWGFRWWYGTCSLPALQLGYKCSLLPWAFEHLLLSPQHGRFDDCWWLMENWLSSCKGRISGRPSSPLMTWCSVLTSRNLSKEKKQISDLRRLYATMLSDMLSGCGIAQIVKSHGEFWKIQLAWIVSIVLVEDSNVPRGNIVTQGVEPYRVTGPTAHQHKADRTTK